MWQDVFPSNCCSTAEIDSTCKQTWYECIFNLHQIGNGRDNLYGSMACFRMDLCAPMRPVNPGTGFVRTEPLWCLRINVLCSYMRSFMLPFMIFDLVAGELRQDTTTCKILTRLPTQRHHYHHWTSSDGTGGEDIQWLPKTWPRGCDFHGPCWAHSSLSRLSRRLWSMVLCWGL